MEIEVPRTQEVRYRPGVMETLKFAWIQYIFVLIPVYLLVDMGVGFLFKYRILEALMISDLKPARKIV